MKRVDIMDEQIKRYDVYKQMQDFIENGKEGRIKELIQGHGISYFEDFQISGVPILCLAVDFEYEMLVKWLIEKDWNIEETDDLGNTALFYAARDRREDLLLYLIEKGSHINHQCNIGYTVLIEALDTGEFKIAKTLYEKGVDVNKRDDEGKSFLDYLWKISDKKEQSEWLNRCLEEPERFDETLLKQIQAKRLELLF